MMSNQSVAYYTTSINWSPLNLCRFSCVWSCQFLTLVLHSGLS